MSGTHKLKFCDTCGVVRVRPHTKQCMSCYTRTRPKFDANKWGREKRAQLRELAIQALGGKCAHCGIIDSRVLQFDHDPPLGSGRKRPVQTASWFRKVIRGAIQGLQLLCANCHILKTRKNGEYWNVTKRHHEQRGKA